MVLSAAEGQRRRKYLSCFSCCLRPKTQELLELFNLLTKFYLPVSTQLYLSLYLSFYYIYLLTSPYLPTYPYLPIPTYLSLPTYPYLPIPTYLSIHSYLSLPTFPYLRLPTYQSLTTNLSLLFLILCPFLSQYNCPIPRSRYRSCLIR